MATTKYADLSRMRLHHVGSFVRTEILDEYKLSVTKAAQVLGVGRVALSNFLNERAGLSPEMAIRLEKAFGVDAGTLLRMQAAYEEQRARKEADAIQVARYVA